MAFAKDPTSARAKMATSALSAKPMKTPTHLRVAMTVTATAPPTRVSAVKTTSAPAREAGQVATAMSRFAIAVAVVTVGAQLPTSAFAVSNTRVS